MADLTRLLARLSALPGPGSPREYRELLGPTIRAQLEQAEGRAAELVERQLASSTYRPTPAEFRRTWLEMVREAGQERDARIRTASEACRYCEGTGELRAYVASRRKGRETVRTYAVTCGCPRGQRLHGAQLRYQQRLTRGEVEAIATRQQAKSEFHDGVLALWIDDATKGARPEWARWAPAMEPPTTRGNIGKPRFSAPS